MTAAVFNPLTVRFLSVGRGLDTVTSVFLIVALGAVAFGVVDGRRGTSATRQPDNGATRPGSR